jgi:phytanoyl-CoA hydroxylase
MSAVNRLKATLDHLAGVSPSYRYTTPEAHTVLTQEQRDQYERDGYILVKGLVDKERLAKYKQRFIEIASGKIPKPDSMIMMRDVSLGKSREMGEDKITKLQDFQDDDVLFSYCDDPNILKYIQAFTGPDIKAVHTMLINKPPNVGASGRHPLHQDLHYFPFRSEDRIACAWTAMERIDRENGCLVVLPGTHKGELLSHGYPEWENDGGVNAMYHGIKDVRSFTGERIYCVMEPGDTLLFHPLLIHGSGANKSKGYRKAISCHYASSHCQYIDVRGTKQAEIGTEIESIAKRKLGGSDVSFQMVWRAKSRLVQGVEDTL